MEQDFKTWEPKQKTDNYNEDFHNNYQTLVKVKIKFKILIVDTKIRNNVII